MRPVRKVDNLTTFLCAVVMKSENLNSLEPSGPLQACNGTVLPFLLFLRVIYHVLSHWLRFLSHTFYKCWDTSVTIAPVVCSIFLPLKCRLFPGDKMQESRVRLGNRVDCGQGQGYDSPLYRVICPRIDNTPVLPHTNTSCAGRLLSV